MAKVLSFRKVRKRNFDSLQNFLHAYAPLVSDDASSLTNRNDLIELGGHDDYTSLDRWIERIIGETGLFGKVTPTPYLVS